MQYFLLLVLSCSFLYSSDKKISEHDVSVTGTGVPSTFVDNINVIFGNLLIPSVDIIVPGPQPLHFIRYYNSKNQHLFWLGGVGMSSNYPLWIHGIPLSEGDKYVHAIAEEDGGSIVSCVAKKNFSKMDFYLTPETIHSGFTNASSEISARTNLKNMHFSYKAEEDHDGEVKYGSWVVTLPNGGTREFYKAKLFYNWMNIKMETKPNGNKLVFDQYEERGYEGFLKEIKATNHNHEHHFASLNVEYKSHEVCVKASNGKRVVYTIEAEHSKHAKKAQLITEVESSEQPHIKFKYQVNKENGEYHLSKMSCPEGRYRSFVFDEKGRVEKEFGPAGINNSEIAIHSFEYHPSKQYTNVFDAKKSKTTYLYSSKKRLKAIQVFQNKNLYREEHFYWGEKDHIDQGERDKSDEGNLVGTALLDASGFAIFCKHYEYDSVGNIEKDTFYGNLSGTSPKPLSVKNGSPEDSKAEKYKKKYAYSDNRFHLKESEWEDDGTHIEYEYEHETDLMTAKYTYDQDVIRLREFFEYNSDAVLVKRIIDDGSSRHKRELSHVSERHITYIHPVSCDNNGVGQPKSITECYLDLATEKEIQLKRVEYEYIKAGLIKKESVFDRNNQFRFSVSYAYDDKYRLIEKEDPLGHLFKYQYDANGNKIREELVGSRFYKTFRYNAMNRLIQEVECHSDMSLTTSYSYDEVGNKTAVTNPFGESTYYTYDELNRCIHITYPKMLDKDGNSVSPVSKSSYNLQDCVTRETDQNGNSVFYEYTSYKKPFHISYPDGTSERFQYNLNGTLFKKTHRNGTCTVYVYDFLKRITKEELYDKKGHLLSSSSKSYNTFHELSSTDPMGYQTFYKYDGAGRLIEERKCNQKTQFRYDSLGRKSESLDFLEDRSFIRKIEKFDNLDRLVSTREESHDGQLLSLEKLFYDVQDNVIERRVYTSQDLFSSEKTVYNSRSLPIKKTDPLGNETAISYVYQWKNELNQSVLCMITQDPLGNKTFEILDAFHRLSLIEKQSAQGKILAKVSFRYDKKGNQTQERHYVCVNGVFVREYIIERSYTSMDQEGSCTEQPRTSEEKTTKRSYIAGLLKDIQKPDGVVIYHSYNKLSQLVSMSSSDGSISYTYWYDKNNNPIKVHDLVHGEVFRKSYDAFNRMTYESCSDARYSYDALDRLNELTFGSGPVVRYTYSSGRLRNVSRLQNGSILYTHSYQLFDLDDHVVKSSFINNLGEAHFEYDALGRHTKTQTPYFEERITSFDKVGNLLSLRVKDALGEYTSEYVYDDLYQLMSETGPISHLYSHDSINNRLQKDTRLYTLNSLNQLLSDTDAEFRYDKNGNIKTILISGNEIHLSYDALDRLVLIVGPSKKVGYRYDFEHRRIAKIEYSGDTKTKEERYFYQGSCEVGAVSSGRLIQFRTLGLGKGADLGAAIAIELDGKVYCPIHDHRGNVVALIDQFGNSFETYRYSAFGEELSKNAQNPWRFSSKRIDPESGFVFFGRRYYSREFGRFLTPDPVGFSDGVNLYAYVHNSPLNLMDAYGLSAFDSMKSFFTNAGKSSVDSFNDPVEADRKIADDVQMVGSAVINNDYSQIKEAFQQSSQEQVWGYAGERIGAVGGMALAMGFLPLREALGIGRWTCSVGREMFKRAEVGSTSVLSRMFDVKQVSSRSPLMATKVAKTTSEGVSKTNDKVWTWRTRSTLNEKTWSSTKNLSREENFFEHWDKHVQKRGEFGRITMNDYLEQARTQRDIPHLAEKVRTNGERVRYDQSLNRFASYEADGTPKTFFKPKTGYLYFLTERNN